MDKISILYICGFYNFFLAVFHVLFWRIFKWKETLIKGTKANAIATQIMNIQLIYLFLFMSVVYLVFPQELLNSDIGYVLLVGYAGFWFVRFIQQFIFLKTRGVFVVIMLHLLFFFGAAIHLLSIFV